MRKHIQIQGAAASVPAGERSARGKADGAFSGRWMAILTHRLPTSRWADTICICAVPVKVTEGEWWWWLRGRRIPRLLAAPAGPAASPPAPGPLLLGRHCPPAATAGISPPPPDSRQAGSALPALGFFQGQFANSRRSLSCGQLLGAGRWGALCTSKLKAPSGAPDWLQD